MKKQTYRNHVRFYFPHHVAFNLLSVGLLFIATRFAWTDASNRTTWIVIGSLSLLLIWIAFMMRQHYSLTLQNRLVRIEFRFRYYLLTGERLEPLEEKLSFAQLAALRFASDQELPALVQRALAENLSPKVIKQSIQQWQPDHMRV